MKLKAEKGPIFWKAEGPYILGRSAVGALLYKVRVSPSGLRVDVWSERNPGRLAVIARFKEKIYETKS